MNHFVKSVAKKIGYVIAAFIIIAAIFVGMSRMLTPVLDKHRTDFEKWASALLETPITIDNVRVSWYGYQPEIKLNKVTILNKNTQQPILEIQQVNVFFSIPQSVWQRKFVPSGILISGANVNVYKTAAGEISVQGFPSLGGFNAKPFANETKFTDLLAWLSQESRLILQNIDVRYTEFNGGKKFLTLYNLSLENAGQQHIIVGKAILHQDIPTEVAIAIKWIGDKPDLQLIKARIYLYVSGFSLSQWMKNFAWNGWQIKEGIVSAKIWATWNHNTFQKIQSAFQGYNLILSSSFDHSLHRIIRVSGNVGWKFDGKNQIFAGDDLLIDLPSHLWPVTSFYVALAPDASGALRPSAINLGYIDFADTQAFMASMPSFLPVETQQMLAGLQLKGGLQNAVMTFTGPGNDLSHVSLNANFSQVSVHEWEKFPGMANLSGTIKWNGKEGDLSLQSRRVLLQYNSIFTNLINLDQLSGDVQWKRDLTNAWVFHIPSLQMLNNDTAANVTGTLTIPSDTSSPLIDLNAHLTMQKVNRIARYLPMRIFDPDLVKWLQQAFLSGEVTSTDAILKGPIKDFPFDKGNGLFSISTMVNNIDLHYAPDWPELKHATGKLTFNGRKLQIDLNHAQIFDIPVTNIHGIIPDLGGAGPQILSITQDDIQTDFAQALKFVHASPLEETIGKMFSSVELNGPLTLKLGLTVPLKTPKETQVQGDMMIHDAQMNLVPWHLMLTNLNGKLHFTENSADANEITGVLFQKPIKLNLSTVKINNISVIEAKFNNNLSISDLEKWLKIPFGKVTQGSTDVSGEIDLSLKQPLAIHLHTNLLGVAVDLPDQYAKKNDIAKDFSTDIFVEENQPLRIKLNYEDLHAALILNHKPTGFTLTGADLRLGTGEASWPQGPGLYITGEFDQLDWDKVKGYVNEAGGNTSFSGLALRNIDVRAKVLNIVGQRLEQMHLQITPSTGTWNINITSPDVVGQIRAPVNFNARGLLDAQFQRLHIHGSTGQKQANPAFNVKSLPSISLVANDVSYNNMLLGQVIFKSSPSINGMTIHLLRIVSPQMNLQAIGNWSQSNTTRLQGNITSANVSALLNNFGFDVHNFIASDGKLNFNLGWRDAPFAPSVAELSGSASLNLGKGRIVNVGQTNGAEMGIGRMLSIFSLQTIPRRLTFDFSDVLHKGYSFDSIRGDFAFRNGDAYTSNLRFDGPVARVGINGRIGLRNKDYDFTLSVTPYVTSSIPLAATLIGGPWAGLAAMAVNTIINTGNVITYYYVVKGPWSNPSWQSVSVGRNR